MSRTLRSFFEGLSVFLHSAEFAGAARTTASAFTRQRKLPLPRLVACLLNALRSGLQNELDAFCDFVLAQTDTPSKSALCQARQRLAPAALLGLLHRSAHLLEAAVAAPRWHGRRVLAIDGTTLRVPDTPECRVHFGGMRTAGGRFRPLARASLLFDVGRGSVLDAQLRDYHCDERSVAAGHLAHLGAGDLGLTDRGFPAYAWFAAVVGRGADFCSRITAQSWTAARDFVRSPDTERWVELAPKRGARTAPLSVRLLKFLRPNGQFLVLVTSVTDPDIPAAAFAALYHGRWRIEENNAVAATSRFRKINNLGVMGIEGWEGEVNGYKTSS